MKKFRYVLNRCDAVWDLCVPLLHPLVIGIRELLVESVEQINKKMK